MLRQTLGASELCDLLLVRLPLRSQVVLHRQERDRPARRAAARLARRIPLIHPGLELWPVIAELGDPLGATRVCRLLARVCRPAAVCDGRFPREVLRGGVFPPAGAWAQGHAYVHVHVHSYKNEHVHVHVHVRNGVAV